MNEFSKEANLFFEKLGFSSFTKLSEYVRTSTMPSEYCEIVHSAHKVFVDNSTQADTVYRPNLPRLLAYGDAQPSLKRYGFQNNIHIDSSPDITRVQKWMQFTLEIMRNSVIEICYCNAPRGVRPFVLNNMAFNYTMKNCEGEDKCRDQHCSSVFTMGFTIKLPCLSRDPLGTLPKTWLLEAETNIEDALTIAINKRGHSVAWRKMHPQCLLFGSPLVMAFEVDRSRCWLNKEQWAMLASNPGEISEELERCADFCLSDTRLSYCSIPRVAYLDITQEDSESFSLRVLKCECNPQGILTVPDDVLTNILCARK